MDENEMIEDIKSLNPSEEAILTLFIRYKNLKAELEKEKEQNNKLLEALDTVNHEKGVFIESYEKEKEKNKKLNKIIDEINDISFSI